MLKSCSLAIKEMQIKPILLLPSWDRPSWEARDGKSDEDAEELQPSLLLVGTQNAILPK